ncbi:MAG: carbonic anhydrase [Bacteroidia bacterium]|jgi:carbonic anhydrase
MSDHELEVLFEANRAWAKEMTSADPGFFSRLVAQQNPEYLWIGCSDSRVPANQIVGLNPGEVFVHRNVANVVAHTDFNCLSVLQFAVDVLKVRHVMVVGHYGCGGVQSAYDNSEHGLIDNWLRNVKDVRDRHQDKLNALDSDEARVDLLCELNVQAQVANVCGTTILKQAWGRGQDVSIHGLVYSLKDGLMKDLDCSVRGADQPVSG